MGFLELGLSIALVDIVVVVVQHNHLLVEPFNLLVHLLLIHL